MKKILDKLAALEAAGVATQAKTTVEKADTPLQLGKKKLTESVDTPNEIRESISGEYYPVHSQGRWYVGDLSGNAQQAYGSFDNEDLAQQECDFLNNEELGEAKLAKAPYEPKQYRDTKDGVIQFMTDPAEVDQTWVKKLDLPSCDVHADPSVEGVWAIDSFKTGERVVVYLGGYKDPWGKVRPMNDFESGQFPLRLVGRLIQESKVTLKDLKNWVKLGNLDENDFVKLKEKYSYMFETAADLSGTEIEEGIVDLIRAENYARLANRSQNKAHDAMVKQAKYGWMDPANQPYGDEMVKQMRIAQQRTKKANELDGIDESVDESGDREYSSWHGWKAACRKAYPGCGFRGDRDIGAATLGSMDVGEWDGSSGLVYHNASPDVAVPGEEQFNETSDDDWDENPYDPDDPAPMVGESEYSEDNSALYSGCYVRDVQNDGPNGEIFKMSGDPEDRRVRISDNYGRGWNISPKQLTLLDDNDPEIERWFPSNSSDDEFDDIDESIDGPDDEFNGDGYLKYKQRCWDQGKRPLSRSQYEFDRDQRNPWESDDSEDIVEAAATVADLCNKYKDLNDIAMADGDISSHKKAFNAAQRITRHQGVLDNQNEAAKSWMAKHQRAIDRLKKEKDTVHESDESKDAKYGVYRKGGSVGDKNSDKPVKTFDTKEEADAYSKRQNASLSKGEKRYYSIKYSVRAINPAKVTESATKPLTIILEGVKFRVHDPKIAKVLRRFPHEAQNFDMGSELDDNLFDALYDYYLNAGAMPYGIAKGRSGDPYNWVTKKLRQEMSSNLNADMNEGANMSDPEIEEIFDKYPYEAKLFKETGELDDGPLYDELFDHYCNNGEMPYGIAKARDGDPVQWVANRLQQGALLDEAESDSRDASGWIRHPDELPSVDDDDDDDEFSVGFGERDDFALDEDSFDPTPTDADDKVLVEAGHDEIIQQLTDIGLDEGLDFFFEGDDLVVIGRSTARAAINAIGGHIVSIDGEEVRIGTGPKVKAEPSRAEVDALSAQPEVFESFNDSVSPATQLAKLAKVIKSVKTLDQWNAAKRMSDTVFKSVNNAIKTRSGFGGLQDSVATLNAIKKDLNNKRRELPNEPVTEGKVKELQQDLKSEKAGGLSDEAFKKQYNKTKDEAQKALKENMTISLQADGEEDVIAVMRRLSGLGETPAVTSQPIGIPSMMAAIDSIQCDDKCDDDYIDCDDTLGKLPGTVPGSMLGSMPSAADEFDEVEESDDNEEYANTPEPVVQRGITAAIANQGNDPGRRAYTVGNVVEDAKRLSKQYDDMKKDHSK